MIIAGNVQYIQEYVTSRKEGHEVIVEERPPGSELNPTPLAITLIYIIPALDKALSFALGYKIGASGGIEKDTERGHYSLIVG